jgi:hypothetical protein
MKPSKPVPHKHEFVILVEWQYLEAVNSQSIKWDRPARKMVTKLRCKCGKEADR